MWGAPLVGSNEGTRLYQRLPPKDELTTRPDFVITKDVRAVVQRVLDARVRVAGEIVGEIGAGLAVLVGVREDDSESDAHYIAEKIANLRVMDDEQGRMDRSVLEVRGGVLVVSQFTLYGDARKGRRPSYIAAARGEHAERLYELVAERLRGLGLTVGTGQFGAMMEIEMRANGPVTILLDSRREF